MGLSDTSTGSAQEQLDTLIQERLDGVAWVKKDGVWGLTVTDPSLFKKLRRKELSPSMSFALAPDASASSMVAGRILPRDEKPFAENSLGTAAHAVLEMLHGLPKDMRTREMAQKLSRELLSDPDLARDMLQSDLAGNVLALPDEDKQVWVSEVDRRALGIFDLENPTVTDVYANELAIGGWDFANKKPFDLKATVNGVPFVGRIDRTDEVKDPDTGEIVGYRVVDYKFGKWNDGKSRFGDSHGDQIRMYKDAVESATGLPVVGGRLIYPTYGKQRDVDLGDKAMAGTRAAYKAAFDRMHAMADANFYPTKITPLASWCPLVNLCPASREAGKEDLTNTVKDANGKRVVDPNKEKTGLDPAKFHIRTVRTIRPSDTSAHSTDNKTTTLKETTMASTMLEGNSVKESTVNGVLNANSYAAMAVFGITGLAVEQLDKAGFKVNGTSVTALSQTFAHIISTVQQKVSGSSDWSAGANTRVRGALRTTVNTLPLPFDLGESAWDEWVASAIKRTTAIVVTASRLFNAEPSDDDRPWAALAR